MGKQSARLYYRGQDHVDILCDRLMGDGGHTGGVLENYYKIYKDDELVWKKEVPKYIFACGSILTTDKLKTFSGFHFYDYRHRQLESKSAYSISFLSGTFFLTTYDGEAIFYSEDGYTWKTLLENTDEKYGTIKRYGNALYVLTSKRLLRISKSSGSISLNTAFNYTDVLKGKECLGLLISTYYALNSFLVGDGYMIVPVWTGNVTRPFGSTEFVRAHTHTLISFNVNTGVAEIVAANLPYNITIYTGGCYHNGYLYCGFWNGEGGDIFGGTSKSLVRRTKDGYAWETYSSIDNFAGLTQIFFAGEFLYLIKDGNIRRTKDGVSIEAFSLKGANRNVFYIGGKFFFGTVDGKICSVDDLSDTSDSKEERVTLAAPMNIYSVACSDDSVKIIC